MLAKHRDDLRDVGAFHCDVPNSSAPISEVQLQRTTTETPSQELFSIEQPGLIGLLRIVRIHWNQSGHNVSDAGQPADRDVQLGIDGGVDCSGGN